MLAGDYYTCGSHRLPKRQQLKKYNEKEEEELLGRGGGGGKPDTDILYIMYTVSPLFCLSHSLIL